MTLKFFVKMFPNLVFYAYVGAGLQTAYNPTCEQKFYRIISPSEVKMLSQSKNVIWQKFPEIVRCRKFRDFNSLLPDLENKQFFQTLYRDFYEQHWHKSQKKLQRSAERLSARYQKTNVEGIINSLTKYKIPDLRIYMIESLGYSGCLHNNNCIFLGCAQLTNSLATLIHEICHFLINKNMIVQRRHQKQTSEFQVFSLQFEICQKIGLKKNKKRILEFNKKYYGSKLKF